MKKIKMFAVAVMFCAAGYAGYTAYERATMTDQERLTLANIEALTQLEFGPGSWYVTIWNLENWSCYNGGDSCCPDYDC